RGGVKNKNAEQSQFRVTSGPAIGYTRCQARIQGELRGDGAAIRQNSTVVSKSVEKCRKVSRSAGRRRICPERAKCFRRGRGASMGRSGRQTECRVEMSGARRRRRAARVMKSDDL